MTDKQRGADIDNPRGYYEWEAIKQIGKQPELLDDETVNGRAIKCISMLLPRMPARKHVPDDHRGLAYARMPAQHHYKVIFMLRPIEEVVASQQAMISRLGSKGAEVDPEQLARGLRAHREEIRQWATAAPNIDLLEVDYPSLVKAPAPIIAELVKFLGPERLPNESAMAAAIDPSLHRQKS